MTSINFDRAADFYDQTRRLGPGWASHGLPALLEAAGPAGRLLEVGVGTGRIAGPLWAAGARLAGCDISRQMLGRLQAKHPGAPVTRGDAHHLPFPAGQFQVALTIHVLHLVGDWPTVLREIRRVLRPGGCHVTAWHEPDPGSPAHRVRQFWRERVAAHGAPWRRPGVQSRAEYLAEAAALGGRPPRRIDLPVTPEPVTLRQVLDEIAGRVHSNSWGVPDEVLAATAREATVFALAEYGDLDVLDATRGQEWLDLTTFL